MKAESKRFICLNEMTGRYGQGKSGNVAVSFYISETHAHDHNYLQRLMSLAYDVGTYIAATESVSDSKFISWSEPQKLSTRLTASFGCTHGKLQGPIAVVRRQEELDSVCSDSTGISQVAGLLLTLGLSNRYARLLYSKSMRMHGVVNRHQ
jgi:hypothetical protein